GDERQPNPADGDRAERAVARPHAPHPSAGERVRMAKDPYKYFRIEARELCDALGKGVLHLEKGGGGAEVVDHLLRVAHTLKGASRVVRERTIAEAAHAVEDALAPHRSGAAPVPTERGNHLLALVDT